MNDFELFLNFGAVVRIVKGYRDDLYKFIKLIRKLGFLNEELKWFVVNMGIITEGKNEIADRGIFLDKIDKIGDEEFFSILEESYSDDYFWHLVEINCGKSNIICIEYQFGKGFTFDTIGNYTSYDNTIKTISVEDLIKACNKEMDFKLHYEEKSFKELMNKADTRLSSELDNFCDFYEWSIVQYAENKFDILDRQTNELVGYFNKDFGTLQDCVKRVFDRMVDYFIMESDIDSRIDWGEENFVINEIDTYIMLGKNYNLSSEKDIEHFEKLKEEVIEKSRVYKCIEDYAVNENSGLYKEQITLWDWKNNFIDWCKMEINKENRHLADEIQKLKADEIVNFIEKNWCIKLEKVVDKH